MSNPKTERDLEYQREIEEYLILFKDQPDRMNALLKLKLHDCSREDATVSFIFERAEWSLNPYGGIHGGAICSLFDTTIGTGAVALCKHFVSTTDLSVSYLKPMNGDKFYFDAEYTQIGRRMIRALGKAIDADSGEVCATCQISYIVTETKAEGLQV